MVAGYSRSPSENNTDATFGVELNPLPGIVRKVNHRWVGKAADSGDDQFDIDVGCAF